ncbi:hypothetical protein ACSBR1_000583 [Camellia fascicularis]
MSIFVFVLEQVWLEQFLGRNHPWEWSKLCIRGPVELATVGVSIAVFNQASRIAIFPLVSVITSFVAEEDTLATASPEVKEIENLEMGLAANSKNKKLIPQTDPVENTYKSEPLSDIVKSEHGKRKIPSASSALFIGSILGLVQTILLILAAKPLLNFMGVKSVGLTYATTYTTILDIKVSRCSSYPPFIGHARSLSWIQGHKNSFMCHWYLISIILLWRLWKQVDLLPPSFKHMQSSRFLKNGFLLLMRVIAVMFCVTLAASRPARQGATSMAAFQVCLQVWLATSLLADGLAVAGQVRSDLKFVDEKA